MQIVYDREEDILTIEVLPDEPIDHAEYLGSFIAHFSPKDRLVLLEVLDASAFIGTVVQASLKGQAELLPGSTGSGKSPAYK
ncbi:MAG TPA: DUF2283 domain-containing protein [Candidatus Fraserbacteria bacterium]|nr:DUF2283 domain-containing protein [Candidatus Fraserbacteria bacterium]